MDGSPVPTPPAAAFGMEYDDAMALRLFGRAKCGNGAGPFGYTTDIFIDTAVAICDMSKQREYATQVV